MTIPMMLAKDMLLSAILAMLLLLFWCGSVDAAPVTVGHPPGCRIGQLHDPLLGIEQLAYSCDMTLASKPSILLSIGQAHIKILCTFVYENLPTFSFEDNSFPSNIEYLSIASVSPLDISSGAFRQSTRLHSLSIKRTNYKESNSIGTAGNIDFTPPTFGAGWLLHITGLVNLNLSRIYVKELPAQQFCILHELRSLDLSHNRINTSVGLGITCTSLNGSCTVCLPRLKILDVSNNVIRRFIVNISENLQDLTFLNMSNNLISRLNLNTVLTRRLTTLDLSWNGLTLLEMKNNTFCNESQLSTLLLQNNKLHDMPTRLFFCTKYVLRLNLAGNMLSDISLINSGINQLKELRWLDISFNYIAILQTSMIGNMTELLKFSCNSCRMKDIEDTCFSSLQKLQVLELEVNNISVIRNATFSRLISLKVLHLSRNHLKNTEFILTLPPLKELYLNHNDLSDVPDCPASWTSLSILMLDGNIITNIFPQRLSHLINLQKMSLADNAIKYLPTYTSISLDSLQELYLNGNGLKNIAHHAFDELWRLTRLRLDNNSLTEFPPLKPLNLVKLAFLNLSMNSIRSINIKLFAPLEWIDLSHNKISDLKLALIYVKKLKFLDLSYNKIHTLAEGDFITMSIPRPRVLLRGNPLHCNCKMEWLMNTKRNMTIHELFKGISHEVPIKAFNALGGYNGHQLLYVEIADLNLVHCETTSIDSNVSFTTISRRDFVCPYQTECNEWTCRHGCCKEDPICPCRSFCYSECECYHKHDHSVNFMDCRGRNLTRLRSQVPIYVKRLQLEDNNLGLLNFSNQNLPHIESLFLSYNHIPYLEDDTFDKFITLKILDLNDNYITNVSSKVFRKLAILEELYLQGNRINFVQNGSFDHMSYLKLLFLHGNLLVILDFSLFGKLHSLATLTLYDNPWSCDCTFQLLFQKWSVTHLRIIRNYTSIYCQFNSTSQQVILIESPINQTNQNRTVKGLLPSQYVVEFDSLACSNATPLRAVKYRRFKSIAEIIYLIVACVVIVVIVSLTFKCRILAKVCLYNKCGLWFRCDENDNDKRPYDVFIAYAKEDERIVINGILPQLELEDNSYKVCLECRDWPPGAATAETIIASIEQSKRTILLISEDHLEKKWCEFACNAAHHQVLRDKQIRLIIVVTDKVLLPRLTRNMQLYIKSRTYLITGEGSFWKKMRSFLANNPRGADDVDEREFNLLRVYEN